MISNILGKGWSWKLDVSTTFYETFLTLLILTGNDSYQLHVTPNLQPRDYDRKRTLYKWFVHSGNVNNCVMYRGLWTDTY